MPANIPVFYAMCDALRAAGIGLMLALLYTLARVILPTCTLSQLVLDFGVLIVGAGAYIGFCTGISFAGIVRWYTLLSAALGYFAWIGSGLAIILGAKKTVISILCWPFSQIFQKIIRPIFVNMTNYFTKIKSNRQKNAKKQRRKSKKQLQTTYKVLYNSNYNTM